MGASLGMGVPLGLAPDEDDETVQGPAAARDLRARLANTQDAHRDVGSYNWVVAVDHAPPSAMNRPGVQRAQAAISGPACGAAPGLGQSR